MRKTLGAVLGLTAAALAAFWYAPYEMVVVVEKAKLRAAGARRVNYAGLAGWEKDGCRPGEECRCVALVHGLGDSALTWSPVLRHSSASRLRVLALEMPGTDGSAPPAKAEGYKIRAQAAALRAALAGRCKRWTVAGNSLGGWISLWLALDWPAGVSKLVLVNAAGIDDKTGILEAAARALEDPEAPVLKEFMRKAYFKERRLPERGWRSAEAAIRARPTAKIVAVLDRSELTDRLLPRLKMPVTVLWGEADGILPVEYGRRLHRLIKGSRWVGVPRCGHLPQQECPDALAAELF